ncbi:tRNA-dihydrouridine synthase A [Teredinibacter turnerae T7901]|uniref:tRNA-dihydrouridine(20/20a) synthase n=1 Tax=Teredinibacter turnerae (strain ATCC 39867 / T7901) TaxID=377629 RepID=C5BLR7_TERTT|nr:tRNA dihydrouridine(20/20a) synthase DusA [Teredinibacter turnerae]ACR10655.1 tRNA-dihydrouridine synthase A [Teredinibacter turnerae T7901]
MTIAPTHNYPSFRFSIAPMMEWSDRHCRYFWRLLTKNALLYTEMVTTGALLNNSDVERFLKFNSEEHPLALQLGGSNPDELARCAAMAQQWGYDEVNLNCGCPSDRVQEGKIGAVLMTEPELVAQCVSAMQAECDIPVTVKHRIGVDDQDEYNDLQRFVKVVSEAGCKRFIVHARKAWLKGLSPKENRDIPPLNYERVVQLKQEHTALDIVINGGITTLSQCSALLSQLDGVMIGREAYHNPYLLAGVDAELYGSDNIPPVTRDAALEQFVVYCREQIAAGQKLHHMSRHILGLYAGEYGARTFRRYITERANQPGASADVLLDARDAMERNDRFNQV